jgi:hypothetical protein
MRSTSRGPATCGAIAVAIAVALLQATSVAGQSMQAPRLAPSGAMLLPAVVEVSAVTGAVLPARFGTLSRTVLAGSEPAPHGAWGPASPVRPARGRVAEMPLQSQESGGFPYTKVGIGLGVAALMITAVITANSGDSAELPRSGVVIVVPGS